MNAQQADLICTSPNELTIPFAVQFYAEYGFCYLYKPFTARIDRPDWFEFGYAFIEKFPTVKERYEGDRQYAEHIYRMYCAKRIQPPQKIINRLPPSFETLTDYIPMEGDIW